MNSIIKSHCATGNFSHGYLLFGDFEDSIIPARKMSAAILDCKEEHLSGHPDFYEQLFDSFSLDDLRYLAQRAGMRPVLSQKLVFILKISSILPEAVISLSGFFENASPSSYFFLVLPSNEQAPAILRSRLTDISEKGEFKIDGERKKFWQTYLQSGPMERLAFSKDAASDKKSALVFLNELEAVMEEKLKNKKNIKKTISFMEEISLMRKHLLTRASYPKMIIEHLALTSP